MRLLHLLPPGLLFSLTTITTAFEVPYLSAITLPSSLQDYFSPTFTANATDSENRQTPAQDLRKRQSNSCPNNYHACSNLGAPGLCCANAAVCTTDQNGNVACCPSRAVCTGEVSMTLSGGTVNSDGSRIQGTATGTAATSSAQAAAGTTTTNGVVIQSNSPTGSSSRAVVLGGGGGQSLGSSAGGKLEVPLFARAILRVLEYLPI